MDNNPKIDVVGVVIRDGSIPVPQAGQAVGWYRAADLDSLPLCPADRELLPFVFPERK